MKNRQKTAYNVPKTAINCQFMVKKSRFIVDISPTSDLNAAKNFIADIKNKYPDAGHHCWAHVAGEPGGSHVLGFSDDGEPNGTAGKPMLNVLLGSDLGDITAVVTRYFGGIKLGTGGLVRAYGGSLNQAMAQLEIGKKIPLVNIVGSSDYAHQQVIEQILQAYEIVDIDKQFGDKVVWCVKMDARQAKDAIHIITERTSANAQFEVEE